MAVVMIIRLCFLLMFFIQTNKGLIDWLPDGSGRITTRVKNCWIIRRRSRFHYETASFSRASESSWLPASPPNLRQRYLGDGNTKRDQKPLTCLLPHLPRQFTIPAIRNSLTLSLLAQAYFFRKSFPPQTLFFLRDWLHRLLLLRFSEHKYRL